MADIAVDSASGSDSNTGTGWGDAFLTHTAAVARAGAAAGDRYFLRGSTGFSESASTLTITSNGTAGTVDQIFAVKDGTTNFPPINSDLVTDRNHSDIAVFTSTGNTTLTIDPNTYLYGASIKCGGTLDTDSEGLRILEECLIEWGIGAGSGKQWLLGANDIEQLVRLVNCDIIWEAAANTMELERSGNFEWLGGSLDTTAALPNAMIGGAGRILIRGVDLSTLGSTNELFSKNITFAGQVDLSVEHCKIGANFTLTTGTIPSGARLAQLNCVNDATLGTGDSVQQYRVETAAGIIENSTKTRTGGATDGATGLYSVSMALNGDQTQENIQACETDELIAWVAGDGTAKTVTVYVVREGAASQPAALQNDEVWMEVWYPSSVAGTDQSMYEYTSTRCVLLGTPTDLTTDTSTWSGTGANQRKQKLSASVSPDYEGKILVKVFYGKRISSPGADDVLYVDPLPEIT